MDFQTTNETDVQEGSGSNKKRMVLACDRCRIKKRKCDGARPLCNNCQRAASRGGAEVECKYVTTQKKRGRKKGYRDALLQKLNYLESMIQHNPPASNEGSVSSQRNVDHMMETELTDSGEDDGQNYDTISPTNSVGFSNASISSRTSSSRGSFTRSPEMALANLVCPDEFGRSPLQSKFFGDNISPVEQSDLAMAALPPAYNGAYSMPMPMPSSCYSVSGNLHAMSKTWSYADTIYPAPNLSIASTITELNIDPSCLGTADYFNALTANMPPHVTNRATQLSELSIHLLANYFTFVNPCYPMFDEVLFFEDLIPVNRHSPALLNALYAYGALHSRHAQLYQAPYHSPRKAAQHFFDQAVEGVDGMADSVEHVQLLVLLGVWDFGNEYRGKSWQFISLAIREAEKIQLGYKNGQNVDYLYSIWKPPKSDHLSPLEQTERRRTWSYTFAVDTFSALVSGLHPGIEEGDYAHVLIEAANHRDDHKDLLGRLQCKPKSGDASSIRDGSRTLTGEWKNVLAGYPRDTIHDFRPEAWCLDPDSLEHICSHNKPWVLQTAYIIRRVLRFLTSTPQAVSAASSSSLSSDASLILSVLPLPTEFRTLHDTIVDWWDTIPTEERAYNSLEEFTKGAPQPALPSVAQLWSMSHTVLNLLFPCAIAMLHHRNVGRTDVLFRVKAGGRGSQGSSLDICVLALRAQAFVVRSVYAAQGFTTLPFMPPARTPGNDYVAAEPSDNPAKTPYSPIHPAPPRCFLQSPMTVFTMFATCLTFLIHIVPVLRRHGDAETVEEGLCEVERLFLPTMDNCSRVWKVCGMYAGRLREVLGEIRGGILPTQGSYGGRAPPNAASGKPEEYGSIKGLEEFGPGFRQFFGMG